MAIGIVAEFDPFHNGHKYLIDTIKQNTGKAVVAVMSGSWVQRGGTAITDKWTRTRMALTGGVDLVFELPVIYSMATAQKFASGAVATLAASGIIDTLAFGSECGDKKRLVQTADALLNEPPEVSARLQGLIDTGMSYAAARAEAYIGIIPDGVLDKPNDILAIEYIIASAAQNAGFDFMPVKRRGAAHDSTVAIGSIASASEIRHMLRDGVSTDTYMPDSNFPIYIRAALDTAVIAAWRTGDTKTLAAIADVSEGLENRFISAAMESVTVDELCMRVKTKRYALSRIRRIAYAGLLGLTKEMASLPPAYIRVLGMTRRGKELLRKMKTAAALPVAIKPSALRGDKIFDFNSRAEDVFALCASSPALKRGGRDLTESPIILEV